jgi:YVTN family beta-propeller protein
VRQERRYRWRRRIAGTGVLFVVAAIAATSIAFAIDKDDPVPPAASAASGPASPSPPMTPPSTPSPTPTRPNVYAADTKPKGFAPAVAGDPARVYVPNTLDGTISVIDPNTFKVVRTMYVGGQPHHITPAWNLRRLYVDNPALDRLTVVDPRTTTVVGSVPVASPYNLYFTPDGTKGIVVAEYDNLIEFRDPHSWALIKRIHIPFRGVDHMDFSANGRYLLVSCEYTGVVFRISTSRMRITGAVHVGLTRREEALRQQPGCRVDFRHRLPHPAGGGDVAHRRLTGHAAGLAEREAAVDLEPLREHRHRHLDANRTGHPHDHRRPRAARAVLLPGARPLQHRPQRGVPLAEEAPAMSAGNA